MRLLLQARGRTLDLTVTRDQPSADRHEPDPSGSTSQAELASRPGDDVRMSTGITMPLGFAGRPA